MSSNTGYIMTLANSIIGVGILAMPFCFQKCGIILSILLLIFSNLITRLACHYLLKTSIKARRKNFEFLASYIFGSSGKLMVELCIIGYLMGSCVTYFVVVGDLGPQIIAKLLNINHSDSLRTITMIIVTIFCIIPLCLLRNIESLSAMCISSIIFYFCLVLKIMFESDSKMLSTYWYDNVYWWQPSGVTQCLPIFSMALSCQLQIFEIYESLPTQTIDKMNHIIKYGTGICTVVYIFVGFFGYVAFYDQIFSGNVLLSLTPSLASDIIAMGFVLSVAVSFPLVIFPCRASLYSLLYHRSHSETAHYIPEHRFKYITISMVFVALIVGIFIPSIELVIGLVGSTIGVAICIMFPASCFIKTNKKNSTERLAAQFLLVFGFVIMILGTYVNLGAIDEQKSGVEHSIDHLPDIHVLPTENIIIAAPKIEKEPIVPMGPEPAPNLIDTPAIVKGSKRKLIKATKQSEVDEIREINLVEKDDVAKKTEEQPVSNDIVKSDAVVNAKPVANQMDLPTTDKKESDSPINNEAIKKEDQEIEYNAKETRQRTKEILDEVKIQLTKQNEETKKLVLKKFDEISEQVNSIAQMQKQKPENDAQMKNETNSSNKLATNQSADSPKIQMKTENENVPEKKIPPPLLAKLVQTDIKSSSSPNPEHKSDIAKPDEIIAPKTNVKNELPSKVEKVNENVGRDLLSNDLRPTQLSAQLGADKTEN